MITAKQIADWAATTNAQRDLPRVIRRLIHSTTTTTQMNMPAGDSTALPGLDGELYSPEGNAWVPKGHSCWEASCQQGVVSKANADYAKRCEELDATYMKDRTYVAITGRKWPGKDKWVKDKIAEGRWADVRAYDADSLEQWLEQSPSVAVAFGEELGIAGPGVTSLRAYLASWLKQCNPKITPSALQVGRDHQLERVRGKCRSAVDSANADPISVRGDSVEEAVAFIAAVLDSDPALASRSVVVTDAGGWHFVEKNAEVRIAIAARPELAEAPPKRDTLLLVVPYASGDMAKQFRGVAGRLDDPETYLDRPDHSDFEKALQDIGVDANDSRRLAEVCGRSWSVFRRQHAINPAIRRPAWLDHPAVGALSTLCLLGTWSSDKQADKEAVAQLAGRDYDELERDLLELEKLDDSPVLHIGSVWKAKSDLELLSLYGDRITQSEIDRFFEQAQSLLSAPDPKLELPNPDRHAAAIYGKVRPISNYLLDALCDTLIKLAVRGPDIPNLLSMRIEWRVDKLVHELLNDADAQRWLSLASELPALAEASPDTFLNAVEASLDKPDAPVRQLIAETGGAGIFGSRCWHAGLLWALETLAWAPQRLTRVSLILAQLTETPIQGNWGNKPSASLVDIYRSWFPQTAATVEQRIAALDVLIARAPGAAADLLNSLVNLGHDHASHIARPKWRDDDAGAGHGATGEERHKMLVAAADRQLKIASQNAEHIAKLVGKYSAFDEPRRATVIELLNSLKGRTDEEKERVRGALRSKIHWHRNYDDDQENLDEFLRPLEKAYDLLAPSDPVTAMSWLFENNWVDLPVRTRDDGDLSERGALLVEMRLAALTPFIALEGWAGVLRLADHTKSGWQVGETLLDAGISRAQAIEWLIGETEELERGTEKTAVAAGLLNGLLRRHGRDDMNAILKEADRHEKGLAWKVQLLTLAPEDRETWNIVESLGDEAKALYWQSCRIWIQRDKEDLAYAVTQLLAVDRPRSAINCCHIDYKGINPNLVTQALEALLMVDEPDVALPQYWYIQHAIDYVEASGEIEPMRLAQLEFGLINALGFEGEHHAVSLYKTLMGQPELLVELLCIAYKPKNGPPRDQDEVNKAAAHNSWSILHACKRQPGTQEDGTLTVDGCRAYVDKVRGLAAEQDRAEICDVMLGEIMARGEPGTDGIFPSEPIREVLEAINSKEMFNGFGVGCFNKRGVTSRGVFDGGGQERALADEYRAHAKALEISHPHVSAALAGLAKSYDHDGEREDVEARLRREAR